jgi:hypothetical protein
MAAIAIAQPSQIRGACVLGVICYHTFVLVPKHIRGLVEREDLLLSEKAQGQLDTGPFSFDDLKHSLLHGEVRKKERDERKKAKYKYMIISPSESGRAIYSCGKVMRIDRTVYFVITFHEAD